MASDDSPNITACAEVTDAPPGLDARRRPGVCDLLLLLWFAVHLLLWVEPELLYQAGRPVFSLAPEFARPFWHECGGLARYLGLWSAQFDAFGWPGALIRVAEAAAIGWLSQACLVRAGLRPAAWLRLVPMALFMLLCGRYDQWPGVAPTLLGILGAAWLFGRMPARGRPLSFAVLAGLACYLFAGGVGQVHLLLAMLALGALCAAMDRRPIYVVVALLFGLAGARWGLRTHELGHLRAPGLDASTRGLLTLALFAFCPLALLAKGWQRAPSTAAPSAAKRLLAAAGVLWLVSSLAMWVTVDAAGHDGAEMDYCVTHDLWDRILSHGPMREDGPRALLNCHDVDLALFYRGRLADDLFRYKQVPGGLILPFTDGAPLAYRWRAGDQYLRLGRLNLAEHLLLDALPAVDGDPLLLRQLAHVYLVKGDLGTARLFLTRLSFDIVHRRWANRYLLLLETDPQLASDPGITAQRALRLTREDALEAHDRSRDGSTMVWPKLPDRMLVSLMRSNRHNRMAYEYLVSMYLLIGQPRVAAQLVRRLSDFGATCIPRGWEEGVALALNDGGPPPDLGRYQVSDEARQSFARFVAIVERHHGDTNAAAADVARECPGTYYAYLLGAGSGR